LVLKIIKNAGRKVNSGKVQIFKQENMHLPTYNKLVRDLIPTIIEASGKKFTTRILDREEYLQELKKKSFEELEEYVNTSSQEEALEELADVLEIIHALAAYHGESIEKIEAIRQEKAAQRGGFQDKIYLVEVED
jgi:predicted house-cleaning noncanonical NTP pyrophosphatase (MazG superfamily)